MPKFISYKCGGRGSRTLVLLTYYRNLLRALGLTIHRISGERSTTKVCCLTWKSIGFVTFMFLRKSPTSAFMLLRALKRGKSY